MQAVPPTQVAVEHFQNWSFTEQHQSDVMHFAPSWPITSQADCSGKREKTNMEDRWASEKLVLLISK